MYKINGLIAVSLLGLTACGGGSGGSIAVVNNGVFKDSNVSGLAYESGDQKDVTDGDGGFKYEEGADVSFSVGGVDLGSGEGKAVMTPIDLVDGGLLTTPEVYNRVRFLMMLDQDNKPSNGIEISPEVQVKAKEWSTIDFSEDVFPSPAFSDIRLDASLEDEIRHDIPSKDDAIAHLQSTLLCANAGAFKGAYSGSESGTIVFVVDPVTGEVNGSSYNSDDGVSVEVSNTAAIDYDTGLTFVSAEDLAKSFAGILKSTNEIEGTWSNTSDIASSGSFEATRIGSDNDSTSRYVAFFTGDYKGVFTFNVTANKVSGSVYNINNDTENLLSGTLTDTVDSENRYKLSATSTEGDIISGFVDADTLAFRTGGWSNDQLGTGGGFGGGGCLLN